MTAEIIPAILFACLPACLITWFITAITVERLTKRAMEREAIARGAGRYAKDEDGSLLFFWNDESGAN